MPTRLERIREAIAAREASGAEPVGGPLHVAEAMERIAASADEFTQLLAAIRTGTLVIESTAKTPMGEITVINRIRIEK